MRSVGIQPLNGNIFYIFLLILFVGSTLHYFFPYDILRFELLRDKMACFNEFGDEQLAIDILANSVISRTFAVVGACATASSEETPTEDPMGGEGYSVAFDPLDGLRFVIDTNFAVGTIWGTWPGDRLIGVTGRELKSAGMAVYGPRTTITIAVDNMESAHEFLLVDDEGPMNGQWIKPL